MNYLRYCSLAAVILCWLVMGLGAYTRLIDAGLGCPDWPGCYGQLTAPSTEKAIQQAQKIFPASPLSTHKALAEMIHRYFAGTLGILVIVIVALTVSVALNHGISYLILGLLLFADFIYQALLGMWTVTLKLLPLIVSLHLMGALILLSLLWLIYLKTKTFIPQSHASVPLKLFALMGLIVLFFQILLGAWTSTNYAALSCSRLPFCEGFHGFPNDFSHAFNLFSPIGMDYSGGHLSEWARKTIHMTHRAGAMIVCAYLVVLLTILVLQKNSKIPRKMILILCAVLMLQLFLGIANVWLQLPLSVAVAHNLCASLLLITVITVNYILYARTY